MTQEEKFLLLKDLCARLPYEVKVEIISYGQETLKPWFGKLSCKDLDCFIHDIVYKSIKPYLRPMSSMTKEEQTEFSQLIDRRLNGVDWKPWSLHDKTGIKNGIGGETIYFYDIDFIYDYLNAHHFDYRGLIEKGLAIEAPKNMYNN